MEYHGIGWCEERKWENSDVTYNTNSALKFITAPGRALRAAVEVSAQKMTFGQTHYYMTIVALSRRREVRAVRSHNS